MARGGGGEEGYTPEVQPEDLPRKIVPRDEGVSAGPEFGQAAAASEKKYQADSATWAGNELANFRLQQVQSIEALKSQTQGDPSGFVDQFQKNFNEQAKAFTNNQPIANNPYASKMLGQGINDLHNSLTAHAMDWQANQQVAYRKDSVLQNLKTQSALVEAHPELEQQIGSTFADQVNSLGGDPSARQELGRQVSSQLALAAANGLTRQDPRGALTALNDPTKADPKFGSVLSGLNDAQREAVRAKANEHLGDNVYNALDSGNLRGAQIALSKNEDLLDPKTAHQLQATINQTTDHNLMLADKIQRDNSNALLKNAIRMSMDGTLTPQYIEQHHNTWEPAAYEYAYGLLSGKKTDTDPHTFAPLMSDALSGKDVSQQAQDALYANKLTLTDYTKILDKSEAPRKGYVARGADYISQSLKPNPLVNDPAGSRSVANALDDWRQATEDHPDMSEEQARSLYRNITDHYQVVSSDKATVFMPVPLQLVGSRMQPDIPSTWAATKKAHDAGQMSDDEYNRQAALIMQWKVATDKKTPPPKVAQ